MSNEKTSCAVLFVHHGDPWIRGSERVLIDHLRHLDRTRFLPMLWTNCGPLADALRKESITVFEEPFSVLFDYRAPKFDIRAFIRLYRKALTIIRRHKVRLVHCNATEPAQWIVPAARRSAIPVIVQLHNESALRSRCVQLTHHASAIVGVCEEMLRPFREDGVLAEHVRVIRNNVDPDRLAAEPKVTRSSIGVGANQYAVVSVGSLTKRKGFDVLLEAFQSINPVALEAVLVVVGDGPERKRLESLANNLGIGSQVRFLGSIPNAPAIVRDIADMFVLSSYWEAAPLVLMEAGFFGLPCIATDVGGVSELIQHESTGLLVPAGDSAALGAAVRRLANEASLRERLGAQLKETVMKSMLSPSATREFESLYDEIIERTEKGRRAVNRRIWYPAYTQWLKRGIRTIGARITRRTANGAE